MHYSCRNIGIFVLLLLTKNQNMKTKLLLLGGLSVTATLFAQAKQPNVVLILADDMRGSAPNYVGQEATITPNLNELSQDAVIFTNSYIMGGTSGAVSMPSRAMLMSGKHMHTLERNGATIPQDHTTIGEVFRANNYTTFHTGKWHNGPEAFNRCFGDGEAIYFGGMADHWNVPLNHYHEDGNYAPNLPVIKTPFENNHVTYAKGDYMLSGQHSVDIFTDVAVNFIDEHADDEKPFFLSVAYMVPHDPRSTYQEYLDMYNVDDIEMAPNVVEEHPFDNGELRIRDEVLLSIPRNLGEVKENIRDYYALVTHFDRAAGQIIDMLKEKGLYENTIIIFAADNGLAMGQHGLLGKQNMYEHSIKVPLMIKDCGEKLGGTVRDEHCLLIDIYPTMCDYLGFETPESVDGLSLRPIIEKNKQTRKYLYHGYTTKQRAVSDGEWKLIEYYVNNVSTTQLFNLKDDPYEMNDLSKSSKYARKVSQLREQMKIEAKATKDPIEFVQNL